MNLRKEKVPVNVSKIKGCVCRGWGDIGKEEDYCSPYEPYFKPSPNNLWGLEVNEVWVGWGQDPLNVYTAVFSPGSISFSYIFRTCPQNFKSPQLWFSLHHFHLVLVSCVFTWFKTKGKTLWNISFVQCLSLSWFRFLVCANKHIFWRGILKSILEIYLHLIKNTTKTLLTVGSTPWSGGGHT